MAEDKKYNKGKFDELGTIGLHQTGGFVNEEILKELQGKRGIRVFGEMRDNDDTVGACLAAIEMIMRELAWNIQEASQDNADIEVADFIKSCMSDMEHTWDDFISEVFSMLPYGWAYHEIVYKRRSGYSKDPTKNSEYNDNRIGWRKLPIRAQDTLWAWDYDDRGNLMGMQQIDEYSGRGPVTIPLDKALHFTTKKRKNNPEGISILRNAYRSWYFKKNIQNLDAIGVERDLAGLPVAYMPPEFMTKDASPDKKATFQMMQEVVSNIRQDSQAGIVMPMAYDESGNKLFDLGLLNSGGSKQFDTSAIIRRYDQGISMSMLADFILLGHDNVGSYALAETKSELFTKAVGAYADAICDVINRFAIPRLIRMNGFNVTKYPKMTRSEIRNVDLKTLGEYISKLTSSGATLFPDDNLENHLRAQADLPLSNTEMSSL